MDVSEPIYEVKTPTEVQWRYPSLFTRWRHQQKCNGRIRAYLRGEDTNGSAMKVSQPIHEVKTPTEVQWTYPRLFTTEVRSKARLGSVGCDADDKIYTRFRHFWTRQSHAWSRDLHHVASWVGMAVVTMGAQLLLCPHSLITGTALKCFYPRN